MNLPEFQALIKAKRLTRIWYYFTGTVEGKEIELKGYKTWLQIYRVNGIRYGNCADETVKQFNAELIKPFN